MPGVELMTVEIKMTFRKLILAATAGILLTATPSLADPETDALMALPAAKPAVTEAYGSDPLQFGKLRLPKGKGPFPVAVVIHGGCRIKGFADLNYLDPLSSALADKGIATWNIEYRQLGDTGAGWPGTFLDWANGTDHLRSLAKRYPLDLGHVMAIGHSAGGHAALWLAGRAALPPSSAIRGSDPLKVVAAVDIDGSGDMTRFGYQSRKCNMDTSVVPFFGGTPREVPVNYKHGNPIEMLPLGANVGLISTGSFLPEEAERYRLIAASKGDAVEVLNLARSGHFDMLDPATPMGQLAVAFARQVFLSAK